jgi:hypothetical protein
MRWACFWHASTSIQRRIFVSSRIRRSSGFKRFLCFVLTDVGCLCLPQEVHIPKVEYHCSTRRRCGGQYQLWAQHLLHRSQIHGSAWLLLQQVMKTSHLLKWLQEPSLTEFSGCVLRCAHCAVLSPINPMAFFISTAFLRLLCCLCHHHMPTTTYTTFTLQLVQLDPLTTTPITLELNYTPRPKVRERTISTERPPLVGEVSSNFEHRGCHVVSVTDPYGRILGFLDGSRYFVLPSSSSTVLTRLSGPRPRPTTYQKM